MTQHFPGIHRCILGKLLTPPIVVLSLLKGIFFNFLNLFHLFVFSQINCYKDTPSTQSPPADLADRIGGLYGALVGSGSDQDVYCPYFQRIISTCPEGVILNYKYDLPGG